MGKTLPTDAELLTAIRAVLDDPQHNDDYKVLLIRSMLLPMRQPGAHETDSRGWLEFSGGAVIPLPDTPDDPHDPRD